MDLVKEFFENVTALGSLVFHGFAGIFFLLTDISIFLQLLAAQSISLLIIVIIRSFYFKFRPGRNKKPSGILARLDASSFPSMHSAHSMTFAVIVGLNTRTEILAFLVCVSMLIAYSRFYLKKHFLIDIFSGLILGLAVGVLGYFMAGI